MPQPPAPLEGCRDRSRTGRRWEDAVRTPWWEGSRVGKGVAAPRVFTGSFAVITVATLAYFLAVGLMIPVIPRYVKGPLGGGSIAIGAAVGAFSVASVLVRPFIGGLGDRRGRRQLIVTGPVLVAGAVALYPVAHHSLALLMALRFVQGA